LEKAEGSFRGGNETPRFQIKVPGEYSPWNKIKRELVGLKKDQGKGGKNTVVAEAKKTGQVKEGKPLGRIDVKGSLRDPRPTGPRIGYCKHKRGTRRR